ncbi:MAG: carbamoyl phosphate synthase small subunit, partial [Stomatobaculum sp.]|nr:carbamoyl phosphate synthase small subunit [Stomatobaculum sp.]
MKAYLILEDGTVYEGRPAGTPGEVISEIVFNTSMTGYQEILTDPSYAGQAVALTYPLIGNYGVCAGDMESGRPFADGLIVREISGTPGSWRAENTLRNFLQKYGITGITGVDTRHLTKQIRDKGTMNGCITTREYGKEEMPALLERIRAYKVEGVVRKTSSAEIREYPAMPQGTGSPASVRPGSGGVMTGGRQAGAEVSGSGKRVALLDTGTKRNIIRSLQSLG